MCCAIEGRHLPFIGGLLQRREHADKTKDDVNNCSECGCSARESICLTEARSVVILPRARIAVLIGVSRALRYLRQKLRHLKSINMHSLEHKHVHTCLHPRISMQTCTDTVPKRALSTSTPTTITTSMSTSCPS